MTAFATNQIPAGVNTIEELFAWSANILYTLHKNTKYLESDSAPLVPVFTSQDGLAADKTERQIIRASIHLSSDWRNSSGPIWLEVQEFSNAPIPAQFLP